MALSQEILDQIDQLPEDWELLPLHNDKRPAKVDPNQEWRVKWAVRSWPRESFASMNGTCHGIGVKLGRFSGGLLQLDFDGEKDGLNQFDAFQQATNHDFEDLPRTVVWSSTKGWDADDIANGKPDGSNGNARFSMAYIVPREFWDQMHPMSRTGLPVTCKRCGLCSVPVWWCRPKHRQARPCLCRNPWPTPRHRWVQVGCQPGTGRGCRSTSMVD